MKVEDMKVEDDESGLSEPPEEPAAEPAAKPKRGGRKKA